MKKERIIFLSPVSYFKGGAEKSLFDLLTNTNIEPVLIAPEDGPILEKGRELGLECHVLPFGSINTIHRPFSFIKGLTAFKDLFSAANELKKLSKKCNAKIVHSNGLKAHAINCTSKCIGGAKAVIHIRDIAYTKAEKLVWYILYLMCSKMILVSKACWPGETLPRKCIVIYNGTPIINEQNEKNGTPEKDKNTTTVAFSGRIHPGKGLHLLIDWFAQAREKEHGLYLSVRGSFSEDAPKYETEIKEQIKKLNIEEYVSFTGHIDDPEEIYNGVDIVVVPSHAPDPLPRSVMESMARGISVMGYPAGGIVDMIQHGKTGYLVKDGEEFCENIGQITSSPEQQKQILKNAREKIEKEFSIPALHQNVYQVYKNL